jgi:hypothetical protein
MKIADFWDALEELGQPLAESGFHFSGKSWVFDAEDYRLTFEAPAGKQERAFQVRALTVCLSHRGIVGPDGIRPWEQDTMYPGCVIYASPEAIKLHESDLWRWHRSYAASRFSSRVRGRLDHCPVYYGGPNRWVLQDTSASPEENHAALMSCLALWNIQYVEVEDFRRALAGELLKVSENALRWSGSMTIPATTRHLRYHIPSGWYQKRWLTAYKLAKASNAKFNSAALQQWWPAGI